MKDLKKEVTAPVYGELTIAELPAFLRYADELAEKSHAQRNDYLMQCYLPYPLPPQGESGDHSPFSTLYRAWVLQQWQRVTGRAEYKLDMEYDNNIEVSQEQLQRKYPFISGDTRFTANYMLGVYFVLKLLAEAPGRQVVEYGVGWGNTSEAFMKAGYDVLAIDIDQKWLSLLELHARQLGVRERLHTHRGQFGELPLEPQYFSAAVFFECFHHALNHDETLASLASRMQDGGLIIFAAETIYRDFPLDWGLRHDGHALWAIRNFGWMELGFSEDYFIRLCRRHNLELTYHVCDAAGPFGVVYKAIVQKEGIALGRSLLTSTEDGFYASEANPSVHTRFSKGVSIIELPCGKPLVEIELRNWLTIPLQCSIMHNGLALWKGEVPANVSIIVRLPNPTSGYFRRLELRSTTHRPIDLGINDDLRTLGIAVGRIRLSEIDGIKNG